MKKFLVKAIPIATIALFILVMLSGSILKRPLGKDDDIPGTIQLIMQDVESEKWEEAYKRTGELSEIWHKIVRRIQFSSERDEINGFSMDLACLKGAILAKDKPGAFMELSEAYEHWEELGK